MSKTITGDITKVITSGYIMHQVNCKAAMGAGVALAICKKWPQVRSEYMDYCHQGSSPTALLGLLQLVKINDGLTVVNSFTQLGFGNSYRTHAVDTDEDKLIKNIHTMAKIAATNNTTLAVPAKIGCGLAGGNWDTVYNNIKDIDNLIIVDFN